MPLTGFSLINKLTHKKYWHYTNPLPIQQWRYSTHTTNHKINVRVIHRHAHTTHATAITHALRITTIATSAMTHAYMCAPYVYVSVAAFFQRPKRFTHKALPGKLPGTSIQSWLPKELVAAEAVQVEASKPWSLAPARSCRSCAHSSRATKPSDPTSSRQARTLAGTERCKQLRLRFHFQSFVCVAFDADGLVCVSACS